MIIEEIEKIAKKIMEKTKEHSPQFIFFKEKYMETMSINFINDEDKIQKLNKIREFIHKHKIKRYIVIMEAWLGSNLNVRPSKDPERREVLILSEYCSDMTFKSIFLYFKRGLKGKIIWEERKFTTNKTDDFTIHSGWNFYVEDVMEELISK